MRGHGTWSFWGGLLLTAGLSACDSDAPAPAARARDYQPATLSEAVLLGNRTAVENFLALGADPNESEADGTTPLMRAVHGQAPEIAEMLIAASADVSAKNSYGVTALYIAARAGDAAETRLLLAAGADANTVLPSSGETVLMTAAKSGNSDVVRALLTGGDDAVSLPEIGAQWSVAEAAESAGYAVPTNPTVATNYANVNARERLYGRTALMIAAAEGHAAIVHLLIEAGSDVSALDEEGSSPLSLARANGYLDVAAAIAAAGGR
jgi:serine/threonine-protein phosphatase 6 regulatory ankyrin repeat subunit B